MLSIQDLEQLLTAHQQKLLREAEAERRIKEIQRGQQAVRPSPLLRRMPFAFIGAIVAGLVGTYIGRVGSRLTGRSTE